MRTILTSVCGTIVLCCLAAFLWTAEAEMQNTNFWTEAAQSSLAEVALSNAALQRAQSAEVRQFAQQMVTDHTAVNQELTQLVSTKGVTIPTAPTDKQQRSLDKLNGRSGADFDREYMKTMVSDHEKAVKLFQRESERGTDAEAKAFAAKTLPSLQSHLTMARTMYETTRTAGRGNNGGNSSNNNSSPNTNSSDVNRSTNVRQDTNRNPNRNTNANGNTNNNTNANTGNTNTNSTRNTNTRNNTNNGNANNTNSRTNANNGNTNNSNVNRY
jgi:predicted outer membrane protein